MVQNVLKSETSFRNFIPKYVCDKLGALPSWNFKIEKIPFKLFSRIRFIGL